MIQRYKIALQTRLEKVIRTLDKFSPYPLFYPFVMSDAEKMLFDKTIKRSHHYLEFGLGGSTLRALQKSKAKIYTVESSPEWIKEMRKYLIIRYFENKRLFIFPVNIGPTREWGYPVSDKYKDLFEAYSAHIFELIDKKLIDLVLIDGRFRVACTLKAILACHENKDFKILIHDFWNRQEYHVVLKYLNVVKKVDTLGLFVIKPDIDLKEVAKDYEIYKFNPK